MTTEEKAKAYDEALDRMKHMVIVPKNEKALQALKETIFPELAESEDERIRKYLVKHVSEWIGCIEHDLKLSSKDVESEEELAMFKAGLAYLEKQKEREMPDSTGLIELWGEEKEILREKDFRGDGWRLAQNAFMDGVARGYGIKQKEQKRDEGDFTIYHPLKNGKGEYECIPYSFYGSLTSFSEDKDLIDFLRICFYTEEECNEWIEQQKEQKPVHTAKEVWKEMRLQVYAQASGNRHEPNYSDDSTKMFSLCDIDEIFEKIGNSTVGSQPAEWSEEDEIHKLHTIQLIEDVMDWAKKDGMHSFCIARSTEALNWLKNLRPQPKCEWSEEDEIILDMENTKIKGWVAVDHDTMGNRRVLFFPQKPVRDLLTEYKYWAAARPNYEVIRLKPDAFPDLQWEDEPIEVELTIKPL